jgi:hypothetical protein
MDAPLENRRVLQAVIVLLGAVLALSVAAGVTGDPLLDAVADGLVGMALLVAGAAYLALSGTEPTPGAAAAGLLIVAGITTGYQALAGVGVVPAIGVVVTVSNLAVVGAFALFLYDRYR